MLGLALSEAAGYTRSRSSNIQRQETLFLKALGTQRSLVSQGPAVDDDVLLGKSLAKGRGCRPPKELRSASLKHVATWGRTKHLEKMRGHKKERAGRQPAEVSAVCRQVLSSPFCSKGMAAQRGAVTCSRLPSQRMAKIEPEPGRSSQVRHA